MTGIFTTYLAGYWLVEWWIQKKKQEKNKTRNERVMLVLAAILRLERNAFDSRSNKATFTAKRTNFVKFSFKLKAAYLKNGSVKYCDVYPYPKYLGLCWKCYHSQCWTHILMIGCILGPCVREVAKNILWWGVFSRTQRLGGGTPSHGDVFDSFPYETTPYRTNCWVTTYFLQNGTTKRTELHISYRTELPKV